MNDGKVVAIPRDMTVITKLFGAKSDPGQTIAGYIEGEIAGHATEGLEFYRMDVVNLTDKPGCLGELFGQKETTTTYNMMTFRTGPRRPRLEQAEADVSTEKSLRSSGNSV